MSVKVKKTTRKPASQPQVLKPGDLGDVRQTHPLLALREEIDSVFDTFFSGFSLSSFSRPTFTIDPFRRFEEALGKMNMKSDVKETDDTFRISAELPGVEESEIEVMVCDGVLSIQAEKKEETHKNDEGYRLSERHYGAVKRRFSLPETAEVNKATANFKNGVLTIDVPKRTSPKAKTRKIPIKK